MDSGEQRELRVLEGRVAGRAWSEPCALGRVREMRCEKKKSEGQQRSTKRQGKGVCEIWGEAGGRKKEGIMEGGQEWRGG